MKLKRVPGIDPTGCDGCVFNNSDNPDGCYMPGSLDCGYDGCIYVLSEKVSPEERQNETKPRFNPEWGC